MKQQLKCVILDDDKFIVEMINDLCKDIPFVKVTKSFEDSNVFLDSLPKLDFDVALLDISMPGKDGLFIARQIQGKQVIFVTGQDNMLRNAHALSPLDVVMKPIDKDRLSDALSKAYFFVLNKKRGVKRELKKYESFSTNRSRAKVLLKLADILLVRSDEKDPRNKHVFMRDGNMHILMGCTFEFLVGIVPNLIRINSSEMVLLELVKNYHHDVITISFPKEKNKTWQLTLSRTFKKDFYNRIESF